MLVCVLSIRSFTDFLQSHIPCGYYCVKTKKHCSWTNPTFSCAIWQALQNFAILLLLVKGWWKLVRRKTWSISQISGLLGKSWLTRMINESELELVHAFVYYEKYICLPKKKSLLGTCGLCGEHWEKAVNEIPLTPCSQPHSWLDILCTQGGRAAPAGVNGAGCSPALIHQRLKPRETPPWWCSHAMGKRGGSWQAKVQQGRL